MKVLCALSGGVDSAVCAHLLLRAGYDVAGAMMRLHDYGDVDHEINAAQNICKQLGIEFIELDERKRFKKHVVDYFMSTYIDGRTPNPCIECNRHLKFGIFLDEAERLGFDKIATGHYAQIEEVRAESARIKQSQMEQAQMEQAQMEQVLADKQDSTFLLHRAKDTTKDQSYVLHFLNQEQLSKILLPLGSYTKDEIRKIANELKLEVANKPESQDICFVENGAYSQFIRENSDFVSEPGEIVDLNGNIVGQHKGLINYTIGQRKGIDIAFGEPMYVTKIDAQNNRLVMGRAKDTMSKTVHLQDFHWVSPDYYTEIVSDDNHNTYSAKLRYRHTPQECKISTQMSQLDKQKSQRNDNDCNDTKLPYTIQLEFKQPISAVTPGQFGVIYKNDYVVGGGTII